MALVLQPVPNGNSDVDFWMVQGDFAWDLGLVGSGSSFTIPDGFLTDGASIPPWAWRMFHREDPTTDFAATLHDALLNAGWERRAAAGEFYHALKFGGVPLWKRKLFYFGVLFSSDLW